jgi:hypothetical protein
LLPAYAVAAEQAHAFVTEQEALTRAQATIRYADQRRGIASAEPTESVAGELTDHTAAVLDAYRELTQTSAADPFRPGQ